MPPDDNSPIAGRRRPTAGRRWLVTDLDGTLIPERGDADQAAALGDLAAGLEGSGVGLLFATGRHLPSVLEAIEEFSLPRPEAIISQVGAELHTRGADGEYRLADAYADHVESLCRDAPVEKLAERVERLGGLTRQGDDGQGRFKRSFDTTLEQHRDRIAAVEALIEELGVPYRVETSFNHNPPRGMVDLLPVGVSKAAAVRWWAADAGVGLDAIVYAGDAANDLSALTAGWRAIVVANAEPEVLQATHEAHRLAERLDRLRLVRGGGTTGLVEGCRWFGLLSSDPPPGDRLGATPLSADATAFRVWAPHHWEVAVEVEADGQITRHALERDGGGCYAGVVHGAAVGSRYKFALADGAYPDPCSRRQPEGVHGPSEVVAADNFPWTDRAWRGVAKRELIVYELHVGAFTGAGTLRAAIDRLPELVELGVTAIELLPLNQTPGKWNWGYDGVNLFAVRETYGTPDDLRALVDAAHAAGLAVLLDVVYNHLGPEGNYLPKFGPYTAGGTPWGDALNYGGKHSRPVRDFIVANARCWLDEYHLDGLRLDAVHFFGDSSEPSILDELRHAVTDIAEATGKTLHLIGESNVHDPELLAHTPERPAYDALWSDCLMHAVYALGVPDLRLTGRDYRGAGDIVHALRHGFVYYGSDYQRSAPGDAVLEPSHHASFVTGLQTHDSVGNHPHGKRLHQLTSKAFQKAAAALTLLHPSIPQVFMGEESAVEAPFPFFVDFGDRRLRRAVDRGRAREYAQHDWRGAPRPSSDEAFFSAKCHDPALQDADTRTWYRRLIELRKEGLREGWLDTRWMTVGYDAPTQVFWLRYDLPEKGAVVVRSRLVGPRAGGVPEVVAGPRGAKVLLATAPVEAGPSGAAGGGGRITLGPNQAVINRAPLEPPADRNTDS